MSTVDANHLHRTMKLELDEGRVQTIDEAQNLLRSYVLQIEVGGGVVDSPTRQAALLTAVNCASRAFIGGVRVRLRDDGPTRIGWGKGRTLSSVIRQFGGELVESLQDDRPTLVIGLVEARPRGSIVLYATWQGWAGGIIDDQNLRLAETIEFTLSGILAGALGVAEAFQHVRGSVVAGRRSVGLSLWNPNSSWQDEGASGAGLQYLPSRLWLIGLGHLGQGYAWALGLLPYRDSSLVEIMLQDDEFVVEANRSTGLLLGPESVDRRKTRVVAERLESLGFVTRISERLFDGGTERRADEPGVVLLGLDNPAPRRLVEGAGFDLIVDGGIGGSVQTYLDLLVHSFPSGLTALDAWPERTVSRREVPASMPAYQHLRDQLAADSDLGDGDIDCGILEVAGRTVGASFVGCVAATIVLSEVLRTLAGGPRFQIIDFSLRTPDLTEAITNTAEGSYRNLEFVPA